MMGSGMVNPVQQSGSVTPGHLATWATDGAIQDGGANLGAQQVLTSLRNANFNDTGDQRIALPTSITAFQLTGIIACNASISLTTAVGGIYPLAAKAGSAIVAAGQVYSSLTASSKLLELTLAGAVATTRYSVANLPDWALYLSLTTAQGAAAAADLYIVGIDLT